MRCPFCNYDESKVVDSRPTEDGESIRRRRECLSCGKRFNTYELIEHFPIVVVKKDGSRQSFDRNKVFNGMLKSCEKRPVGIPAHPCESPSGCAASCSIGSRKTGAALQAWHRLLPYGRP